MSRRSRLPGYVSRAIVSGGGGGDPPPGGERDWGYIPIASAPTPMLLENQWIVIPNWYSNITAYGSDNVVSPRNGQLAYVGDAKKTFLALAVFELWNGSTPVHSKVGLRVNGRNFKEYQGVSGSDPIFGGVYSEPWNAIYDHQTVHHGLMQLTYNEYIDGVASAVDVGLYQAGLARLGMTLMELRGAHGVIQDLADSPMESGTVWIKIPGTTASYLLKGFSSSVDTRLTYTDTVTRRFRVDLAAALECGQAMTLGVYKNGTLVTGSDVGLGIYGIVYGNTLRTHCFVELAQNDYVEGWWYHDGAGAFRYGMAFSAVELGDSHGLLYMTAQGSIPFSLGKLTPTTALSSISSDFSMPDNNKLQYTGATTKRFLISADVHAYDSSAAYVYYELLLYKNGTALSPSTNSKGTSMQRRTPIYIQAVVELAQNDYIEVYGASGNSGSLAVGYVLSAAEFA